MKKEFKIDKENTIAYLKYVHNGYSSTELRTYPGDRKLRYELFSPIIQGLMDQKIIYRERLNMIVSVDKVIVTPERFLCDVTPYKLIKIGSCDKYYSPDRKFSFGATWDFIALNRNYFTSYAVWSFWFDTQTVEQMEKLVDENKWDDAWNLINEG